MAYGGRTQVSLEITLMEKHGLTLPSYTYPQRGIVRGFRVSDRREALADVRPPAFRSDCLCRRLFAFVRATATTVTLMRWLHYAVA